MVCWVWVPVTILVSRSAVWFALFHLHYLLWFWFGSAVLLRFWFWFSFLRLFCLSLFWVVWICLDFGVPVLRCLLVAGLLPSLRCPQVLHYLDMLDIVVRYHTMIYRLLLRYYIVVVLGADSSLLICYIDLPFYVCLLPVVRYVCYVVRLRELRCSFPLRVGYVRVV